jgi:hypothetical protein
MHKEKEIVHSAHVDDELQEDRATFLLNQDIGEVTITGLKQTEQEYIYRLECEFPFGDNRKASFRIKNNRIDGTHSEDYDLTLTQLLSQTEVAPTEIDNILYETVPVTHNSNDGTWEADIDKRRSTVPDEAVNEPPHRIPDPIDAKVYEEIVQFENDRSIGICHIASVKPLLAEEAADLGVAKKHREEYTIEEAAINDSTERSDSGLIQIIFELPYSNDSFSYIFTRDNASECDEYPPISKAFDTVPHSDESLKVLVEDEFDCKFDTDTHNWTQPEIEEIIKSWRKSHTVEDQSELDIDLVDRNKMWRRECSRAALLSVSLIFFETILRMTNEMLGLSNETMEVKQVEVMLSIATQMGWITFGFSLLAWAVLWNSE